MLGFSMNLHIHNWVISDRAQYTYAIVEIVATDVHVLLVHATGEHFDGQPQTVEGHLLIGTDAGQFGLDKSQAFVGVLVFGLEVKDLM